MLKRLLSVTRTRLGPRSTASIDDATTATSSEHAVDVNEEDLVHRKHHWQVETEAMSEFLVIRPTLALERKCSKTQSQQTSDGIMFNDAVNVLDIDGLPTLRAVFDVHHFHSDEVSVRVENNQLFIQAKRREDTDHTAFRKTLIRRIELPANVDNRRISSTFINEGLLQIEMPFHLSPRRYRLPSYCCWPDDEKPALMTSQALNYGPVVPILTESNTNNRFIRLNVQLGPDFIDSDVTIKSNIPDRTMCVVAEYVAEVGVYGSEIIKRRVSRTFRLPSYVQIDRFEHVWTPNGCLLLLLILNDAATDAETSYRCHVTTTNVKPPTDLQQ